MILEGYPRFFHADANISEALEMDNLIIKGLLDYEVSRVWPNDGTC